MAAVELRAALAEDAAALADLVTRLGYRVTREDVLRRLGAIAGHADHLLLIAVEGERPIGFLHACVTQTLEHDLSGEIRSLAVDEAYRSRGVGQALVDAAERWLRGVGLSRMRVRSNVKRTRAHRFYERLGYTITKAQNVFDKEL